MKTQENTTYNGWTNWDTWNAYNWLTSEEWSYGAYLRCDGSRELEHLLNSIPGVKDDGIDMDIVNFNELLAHAEEE